MTQESSPSEPAVEWAPAGSRPTPTPRGEDLELDRLPPPAFPPGSRRAIPRPLENTWSLQEEADESPAADAGAGAAGEAGGGEGGALDPDPFASALISPDDPFPHRSSDSLATEGVVEAGEGKGEAHHEEPIIGVSRAMEAASRSLEALSGKLRAEGLDALRVGPGTSGFDAALRGFIRGYLAASDEAGD